MLRLEKRPNPSKFWLYGTPVVAVILTMVFGGLLFASMGKNPFEVIRTIFWDPIFGEFAFYLRGQLLVKAGPLILIAVGLALGFRAGDRVLMRLGNTVDFPLVYLGAIAAGLVPVPTSSQLTEGEVARIAADIHPALIVAAPGVAELHALITQWRSHAPDQHLKAV